VTASVQPIDRVGFSHDTPKCSAFRPGAESDPVALWRGREIEMRPSPFLHDPRDEMRRHVAQAVASPIEAVRAIHIRAAEHQAALARASGLDDAGLPDRGSARRRGIRAILAWVRRGGSGLIGWCRRRVGNGRSSRS
jgi:hypothetical protein